MKVFILLVLTIFTLTSSAQFLTSYHARERSQEREVDLEKAEKAIFDRTAEYKGYRYTDKGISKYFEGYYKLNRRSNEKVDFCLVKSLNNVFITVWRGKCPKGLKM
ncbi:hypothetical protein PVAND_011076 [Polypedilum vanderplanki]|uniref:Uncharacterized protein n=1 Tax=Polypedilum vanderplanki TaxID=319348 RepID=A0A9J6CJB5_POLVA|nr:hypothetical protein PVAND_011076 [Polypedilum vanderplanki]